MRLRYDKSIPASPQALVLLSGQGRRVELHLRREADEMTTLVALGGARDGAAPEKILHQGPYHHPDQATAAKRAIAAQLSDDGFVVSDELPRWSLAAQRSINTARREREQVQADYRFDPKDVYLDW